MRNHRVSKIMRPVAIVFAALAVGAAFVAPTRADAPNVGSLLFGDNFTTSSPSSDINAEINSFSRTSGPLAGVISYDAMNAVGNISLDGSGVNLWQPVAVPETVPLYTRVGLNYNFNGGVAAGGLKISYDVKGDLTPDIDFLFSGCDSSAIPEFYTGSNWNAWMTRGTVWGDSQNWLYYAFIANAAYTGVAGNTGASFSDAQHHMDIVASDATDASPFNGIGTLQLDYYIDGAFITTYNGDDFVNNYIGLEHQNYFGSDSSQFDNLQIYGNALMANTSVQWQSSGSQNWTDPASWTTGAIPNARGAVALFLDSAATTANVNENVTIGSLVLRNYVGTISSPTGSKITFWTNAGTNCQIQAWDGYYTIASPMELKNDLDIVVNPGASLTLSGAVSAAGAAVNLNINGGNYAGTVIVSGNTSPSGAVAVNSGALELIAGATLTATSVTGDGHLWIDGGTLAFPGGGAKPTINVKTLGLGMTWGHSGSYSLDAGETVTVDNLTGDMDLGFFHFNGGTLAARSTTMVVKNLAAVYLDADSTVDGNGHNVVFSNANLQNGATTGKLAVKNAYQAIFSTANTFTGGTTFADSSVVLENAAGLGMGAVDMVSEGRSLTLNLGAEGVVVNDFTFHGRGPVTGSGAGNLPAIYMGWGASATLSGKITLNNDSAGNFTNVGGVYSIPGTAHEGYLTFSGQITGPGGLQFGFPTGAWDPNWAGFRADVTGSSSNNYQGDTAVLDCAVHLAKTDGAIAIPSAHVTLGAPIPYGNGALYWHGDDQINPGAVITMNSDQTAGLWTLLQLNGHQQTLGGLSTATANTNNYIRNDSDASAKVTINGGGTYSGYMYDNDLPEYGGGTGKLSLEKSGAEKLTLLLQSAPSFLTTGLPPVYTGTTTITQGTLEYAASVTLEGDIVRKDATHSGTLEVGDAALNGVTLQAIGKVDLGAVVINTGNTLYLGHSADPNVIDNITGDGTLQVGSTDVPVVLTATSIHVGTLTLGGPAPVTAAAVPEPSTMILLALAGAALGLFMRRK